MTKDILMIIKENENVQSDSKQHHYPSSKKVETLFPIKHCKPTLKL